MLVRAEHSRIMAMAEAAEHACASNPNRRRLPTRTIMRSEKLEAVARIEEFAASL